MINNLDIPAKIEVSSSIWSQSHTIDWSSYKSLDFVPNINDLELLLPPLWQFKNRGVLCPNYDVIGLDSETSFDDITRVMESFPENYLNSMMSFNSSISLPREEYSNLNDNINNRPKKLNKRYYEIAKEMKRFFHEDCSLLDLDDPLFEKVKEKMSLSTRELLRDKSDELREIDAIEDGCCAQGDEFVISSPVEYILKAQARLDEYVMSSLHDYTHYDHCNKWVEEHFIKRMSSI